MCGIAGFTGKGDKKTLRAMLNAISHRGPDEQGMFFDGDIGLGNNRLAIIDLSKNGKQPMFDNSKLIYLVFNGEIYNFKELRKELELKHKFKTNTDTEVLLFAYKEWGIDCLKKLNGMFSFVIFDKKNDLLFGARDRLGEKPLKYYFDGKTFAFASEIKGLLPFFKEKPKLDPIAINNYLTCAYISAPLTGFKDIFKLQPGHYFTFKRSKLTIKKYWSVSFEEKWNYSEKKWEQILLQKLNESVKSRLISDVPLGVFLSGGVDSSALVALVSKATDKQIKTFTLAFEDPKFDESSFAEIVAKQYKTSHRIFSVNSKNMGDVFSNLANYYDEPFADNSVIPTIILAKFASRYIKVALTGDGGDENFAGYERFNVVAFSDLYKNIPESIRDIIQKGTNLSDILINSKLTNRANVYTCTFKQPFYKRYINYNSFFGNDIKLHLYTSGFKNEVSKFSTFDMYKNLYNPKLSNLDNALLFDILNYLPEDLLYKTDIATMAYSIEARAPFLNHELVELMAKMPDSLKIKFFNKKYVFKKVLDKNQLVSKQILNRRKMGFVAPIDKWLKEDYKDLIIESLFSKKFKDSGIFDQLKLEEYLKRFYQNKKKQPNNIFALFTLSMWVNKYL